MEETPMADKEEDPGDDLCDLCHTSGVNVSRTTCCGKTIGIECGCDDTASGFCGNPFCDECLAGAKRDGIGGAKSGAKKRRRQGSH